MATQRQEPLNELALVHAHRDFARVFSDQTVGEALAEVRRSRLTSRIVYFYVVDRHGALKGIVPTRHLLLSPLETPIASIMVSRVIALPEDATLLNACETFVLHRLLALPIVDSQQRVLGVIDVDQYTDEIRALDARQESEEIFQLIGVRLAMIRHASLPALFRNRFPWLLCNVAGGVACAFIAGLFEGVLDTVILIALFIPVVLTLAESVSIQSLTLALQVQHRRPTSWPSILRTLSRELPLGVLLGFASGSMVGAIAWLWQGQAVAALCILFGIAASVMLAAAFGLLIPSLLHKLQRDPKVASGPMVLALTDITTTFVYLGVSTWALV